MDLALEEIIRVGLLLEVNEFLIEWPHASFRDYLAGRRLFELVDTDQPFDTYPLDKLGGAAAAAHATTLVTTQSRRLENRSKLFLAMLRMEPSFAAVKVVAEEYHTSLEYYISTEQDLACDAQRYQNLRWGERFLETYQLVLNVARREGLPGVEEIPSPQGLVVFFDTEADFCLMMFSEMGGIHYDQLSNFQPRVLQLRKKRRTCSGFCLFAPLLPLLDPEIMAYLQVGVWLRLEADSTQIGLNEWHNGLATYKSPRSEWLSWEQSKDLPAPDFELCAGPQQTLHILHQTYGVAQVNQLRTVTDILPSSRKVFLSWQEIYTPITFRIDPIEIQEPSRPVSNRVGQMMVLTPPSHHISLALLMPWNHKTDFGVDIFVPFPVPLLNRYYFFRSASASSDIGVSFVHLCG